MPTPMSSPSPVRRGRPPSQRKRAAILDAATTAFLRDGYVGTNLDDVAAAANVSKQTVYRHFTDKKSLFIAAVEAARQDPPARRAAAPDGPVIDPDDVAGSLSRFAEGVLRVVLSERVAALRRVMIGELGRIPELRALWSSGAPTALAAKIADELTTLDGAGVLDVPDPWVATELLFALMSFPAYNRTAYGVTPLSDVDRKRIAEAAAEMFVRAYWPR